MGVGAREVRAVPGVLDYGNLHAQAYAEVRNMVLPGVLRGQDHAFDAAASESAGDDHPLEGAEGALNILFRQGFGVNPGDFHPGVQGVSGVAERLRHGQVGVVQLYVFPDQADLYRLVLVADTLHHFLPVLQVRLRGVDMQFPADNPGEVGFLQHEGRFVEDGKGHVLDHTVRFDVAEVGNLGEDGSVGDFLIHPQDNDVRVDAHSLQFLDGVLGGFGFVFPAGLQVRDECHVDVQGVLPANFQAHLADGFDKRLALNVADRAADFGDHHVRVRLFADAVDKMLDLVRDMRNRLHGAAQVAAFPLLPDHVGIDLPGGQVGILVQVLVDKAFIMAQVQVGFRAVLGHVHLAVLVGAHCPGIHIDIRIQLLGRDLQAAGLQQASQGRCRNSLSQSGYHTAGYKDILRHTALLRIIGPRHCLPPKTKTKRKGKGAVCTAPLPCWGYLTPGRRGCQYSACTPAVLVWTVVVVVAAVVSVFVFVPVVVLSFCGYFRDSSRRYMRSAAVFVSSAWPKADRRKKPSPQGPKPSPGVPTTWMSFSIRSKNSQLPMPPGQRIQT